MKKTLLITSFVLLFILTIGFASAADSDNLTDESLISVVSDDTHNTQIEQTDNTEYKLNEIKKTDNLLSDDGRDTPVVDVNNCTAFEGENVIVRFNVTDSSGALICGDVNVTVSGENRTVSEIIKLNNASAHYSMADLIGFIKANDKSNIPDIYNIINSSFDSTKSNTSGLISGFGDIYNGLGVNVSAFISIITDTMNSSDVDITRIIDGGDNIKKGINIPMLMGGLENMVKLSSIDIPTFSTILHTFMEGFDFNVAGIIDQFRKGVSFNKTLLTSGINDINNELGIFKSNNIFNIMNDLGLTFTMATLLKAGSIFSKDIIIYWDLVDLFKDILNDNHLTPAKFIERTLKQDEFNLKNIITKISNSDLNRNNIIKAITQIRMATKIDYNLLKSTVKNIETSSFNSSKVINELASIPEINISDSFDSSKIRSLYKLIKDSTLNISSIVDGSNEIVAAFKFHITDRADAINRLKNSFNFNTSMIMNGLDIFVEAMGINVSAASSQIIKKYGYFIIISGPFAPGIYNVSAKYLSNDRYDSAVNDTAKLTVVNKKDTSIEAYAVVDKTNVSIKCHLPSNTSGIVVLEFEDYFSVVPFIKGNFSYESNFTHGDYNVKVLYFGNRQFSKNNTSVSFTVKIPTKIAVSDVKTTYDTSKNLAITLTDTDGNPLKDKEVVVELNGIKYKSQTNDNGQVSITVPKKLVPNTYTASISFASDDDYIQTSENINVVVSKAKPKITAKAKTFKVKTKTKKYTLVLKNDKNNAITKAKLTIKLKGKTYTATTNSKGKATFKINKLTKKGKHIATIKYNGNKYYNKISKKVKITIK